MSDSVPVTTIVEVPAPLTLPPLPPAEIVPVLTVTVADSVCAPLSSGSATPMLALPAFSTRMALPSFTVTALALTLPGSLTVEMKSERVFDTTLNTP